jgi:ribonuclease HI
MAVLPEEHPLHKTAGKRTTGKIKRHKAPMNSLAKAYGYNAKKFEKLPTAGRDPGHDSKTPFTISIAEDKDSSAVEAENATEEVQVYTDGSAIDGKVGAVAILIRAGSPKHILHLHLGPESEHTVHEAELVGIMLGLHLVGTEKRGGTTFAIGVDNQAAIKAFQSSLRSPGHHLARKIIQTANQIQKRRKKAKYSLTIRWTAGHVGIAGNEDTDKEAKNAANGLSTDKSFLPSYLRKNLPINPAAVKRAYHEKLKGKWTTTWRNSERGKKTAKFDKTAPLQNFLKAISRKELS